MKREMERSELINIVGQIYPSRKVCNDAFFLLNGPNQFGNPFIIFFTKDLDQLIRISDKNITVREIVNVPEGKSI